MNVKFEKDLLVNSKNITFVINTEITKLDQNKNHKHLGIKSSEWYQSP